MHDSFQLERWDWCRFGLSVKHCACFGQWQRWGEHLPPRICWIVGSLNILVPLFFFTLILRPPPSLTEHSEYMGCQRRQETENDETSCSREEEGVSHRSPLFLMVNHQSPHTGNTFRSYEVPSRFLDRVSHVQNPERKNHAALVASLDDTVGRVVKALDQEEVRKVKSRAIIWLRRATLCKSQHQRRYRSSKKSSSGQTRGPKID